MYDVDGKFRLIMDVRKGNCFFVTPESVELVFPTAIAQMHLDVDEVVMGKAGLLDDFYRCRIDESCWPYFGRPALRLGDLGLTKAELKELAPGMGEEETVHPVMCVLPVGWAHSPLIAQEAQRGRACFRKRIGYGRAGPGEGEGRSISVTSMTPL